MGERRHLRDPLDALALDGPIIDHTREDRFKDRHRSVKPA
jgi:hypothetical protein